MKDSKLCSKCGENLKGFEMDVRYKLHGKCIGCFLKHKRDEVFKKNV